MCYLSVAFGIAKLNGDLRIIQKFMTQEFQKLTSLLNLIYDLIIRGTISYAVHEEFRAASKLINEVDGKDEANVYNIIVDSLFRNLLLSMVSLFDDLNLMQGAKPKICPHGKKNIPIKQKRQSKGATFSYLASYIERNKQTLKEKNQSKLSMPFDAIYAQFFDIIETIKSGNNELVRKFKKIRNKLVAHNEIKLADNSIYEPFLKELGITYENIYEFIRFVFTVFDKANLLIMAEETGWNFFIDHAKQVTRNFFTKMAECYK